jgi:hypothetical protein
LIERKEERRRLTLAAMIFEVLTSLPFVLSLNVSPVLRDMLW